MDPEPVTALKTSVPFEQPSNSTNQLVSQGIDEEDSFSLSGTSSSLFGLAMAIAVLGVPFLAVLTERPRGRENLVPTALQSDGSKSSSPISLTRLGEPRR